MKAPLALALTAAAIASFPATAIAEESRQVSYECVSSGNEYITLAASQGREVELFNWNAEEMPSGVDASVFCQQTADRLNSYGSNNFYGFAIADLSGTPSVCLESAPGTCARVLFSLPSDRSIADLNALYNQILVDELRSNEATPVLGYESSRHRVNIFQLVFGAY